MKTFSVLLLPAIVTFLASCNQTSRQPDLGNRSAADSLRQVLLSEVNQYYADMSARNWEVYASHFWPDASLTTVWQPPGEDALRVVMTDIEEFVEQADEGPGSQPVFEEEMLEADVKVYGNLAAVWATYTAKFGTRDSLIKWKGIDAFTYMKHEGKWRIVSLAYINLEE